VEHALVFFFGPKHFTAILGHFHLHFRQLLAARNLISKKIAVQPNELVTGGMGKVVIVIIQMDIGEK